MDPDVTAGDRFAPPERLADAPAALGEVIQGRWSVTEILSGGQAWVLIVNDVEQGNRRAIKVPFSGSLTGRDVPEHGPGRGLPDRGPGLGVGVVAAIRGARALRQAAMADGARGPVVV